MANAQLEEVIVTAQKDEESVNKVPMSITAVTSAQLQQIGIKEVADLVKITPGLNYGVSTTGTPVFSMRGVGYNDAALSARPAVTVYLDEAPIPFSMEVKGASFDVERVEVLKGPQGTLFGNNSTGGAINYIAAKPTTAFEAGGSFTYGRFNEMDFEGYVSGPINDELSARLAIQRRDRDAWQKSYTHGGEIGETDFFNARNTWVWEPLDTLRAQLTLSYWKDKSDAPAGQVVSVLPIVNAFPQSPLIGYQPAPHNTRDVDFDPNYNYARDNKFFQGTGRIDYNLSDSVTLTSLTTYMKYDQHSPTPEASPVGRGVVSDGEIESYSQELRFTGEFDRLRAIVGAMYAGDKPVEANTVYIGNTNVGLATGMQEVTTDKHEDATNQAIFTNLDYELTPELKLQGGVRYTKSEDDGTVCARDTGDGSAAGFVTAVLNGVRGALSLPSLAPIAAGSCVTFDTATLTPTTVKGSIDEDNVSWRTGIQYEPADGRLFYANVSKGYKAGGYPTLVSFTTDGYDGVTQESVLAYELGFKLSLLDRAMQLNGAVFRYDYEDKQVTGSVSDPFLGTIAKQLNVPKSQIVGTELEVVASPLEGLTLNLNGTYIESEVQDHYTGYDSFGKPNVDFDGTLLPFAPRFQASAGARYKWGVSDGLNAFVGANASYQSRSYSDLGEIDATAIDPYTLVDLQAGVEDTGGRWTAFAWGHNVFDEYYWYNTVRIIDTVNRFAGSPATYGVTVSFKY